MTMALAEIPDPDEPIVEAIRSGDRFAFTEFARRNDGWVRGVIFGVLGDGDRVDDVAQMVWTAVWKRIPDLRDTARWRPWVYRLARNAAVDAGRDTTRRRKHKQFAADMPVASASATPDAELAGEEQHREVLNAIRALPVLYREPFVLRHLQGWNYRRIAEAMDLKVDSVETRLVRARRLLREALRGKMS